MIKNEDTLFASLESLSPRAFRKKIEFGCSRIYSKLFGEDIDDKQFDFLKPPIDAPEVLKWRHILKNRLVTVRQDSRNLEIDDLDILTEAVYGIAECVEYSGYTEQETKVLLSEFLSKV